MPLGSPTQKMWHQQLVGWKCRLLSPLMFFSSAEKRMGVVTVQEREVALANSCGLEIRSRAIFVADWSPCLSEAYACEHRSLSAVAH